MIRTNFFSNNCSSITYFKANGNHNSRCVVIFSSFLNRELNSKVGGANYFLSLGIDVFSVQSKVDDWHQSLPFSTINELSLILETKFNEKYSYGSSMGGYAAILFARKLGIKRVLALSPQFSIRDQFDKRWEEYAYSIKWNYDFDWAKHYKGDIWIAYDPHDADAIHVSKFKNHFTLASIHTLLFPYSSHPVTTYLFDANKLNELILEVLINGKFPKLNIDNKINETYLYNLAHFLFKKNKNKSALLVVSKATEAPTQRHQSWMLKSHIHLRLNDIEESKICILKALELSPNDNELKVKYNQHLKYLEERTKD